MVVQFWPTTIYPGLGIFYILASRSLDTIPAAQAMKGTSPGLYSQLLRLQEAIHSTEGEDYQGVSILCASYIPPWSKTKSLEAFTTTGLKNLEADFHSPSYEFKILRSIFENEVGGEFAKTGLGMLIESSKRLWSFNSTIHLPWTSKLSVLSNGLMGDITNRVGDHATRYGVGYDGKSMEIIRYQFGENRRFPFGVAGMSTFVLKVYPDSECFEGTFTETILSPRDGLWAKIAKAGLLKTAIQELGAL